METQNECLEALAKGETLTNQYGVKVHLDKFGFQIITGKMGKMRKGCPYAFSSPEYWSIMKKPEKEVSFTFVLLIFLIVMTIGLLIVWKRYQESTIAYQEKVKVLQETIIHKNTELLTYSATEQELIEFGATSEQAKDTIKAAEVHRISPKF